MPEYRDVPKTFAEPTPEEIKARSRRNIAIALGLAAFIVLVAISIIVRQPI